MAIGPSRRLALAATLSIAAFAAAAAAPVEPPVLPEAAKLVPHRAVYDLDLGATRGASTVAAVTGRMVFEFTGSPCQGFSQNMRFVMNVNNRDGGSTLSDLRSNTFETSNGDKYKFKYNDYTNQEATDTTTGDAARQSDAGSVAVTLAKPSGAKLSLNPGTLFPVQHTIHLLAAALRGDHMMAADLYDGSDNGQKTFFTNTLIGPVHPGGAGSDIEPIKNADKLAGLRSWPIAIAYYGSDSAKAEGIPEHEMSFQLYENGVVRKLLIDYGNLSIKGTLAEIEFLEPEKCP